MKKYRKRSGPGATDGAGSFKGEKDAAAWGTALAGIVKDLGALSVRIFPFPLGKASASGSSTRLSGNMGMVSDPKVRNFAQRLVKSRRFAWLEDAFAETRLSHESSSFLIGKALFEPTLQREQKRWGVDEDKMDDDIKEKHLALQLDLESEIESFAACRSRPSSAPGSVKKQLVVAPTPSSHLEKYTWPPQGWIPVLHQTKFTGAKEDMYLSRAGFLRDEPTWISMMDSALGAQERWEPRWSLELGDPGSPAGEMAKFYVYDVPVLWDGRVSDSAHPRG